MRRSQLRKRIARERIMGRYGNLDVIIRQQNIIDTEELEKIVLWARRTESEEEECMKQIQV